MKRPPYYNDRSKLEWLLITRYLAYGGALEIFLISLCLVYSTVIAVNPEALNTNPATRDVGQILMVPFLVKAIFQFIGLVFNIRGIKYAHAFRFIGAVTGACIWGWFIGRMVQFGMAPMTTATVICSFFASIYIAGLAIAGLPQFDKVKRFTYQGN